MDNAGSQPPNIPNSYVGPSAASNPKHHQPQSKIKIKEINIKIKEGIKIKNKKGSGGREDFGLKVWMLLRVLGFVDRRLLKG